MALLELVMNDKDAGKASLRADTQAARVYTHLVEMNVLNTKEFRSVNQSEVGRTLGMPQSNVRRALFELTAHGLLRQRGSRYNTVYKLRQGGEDP